MKTQRAAEMHTPVPALIVFRTRARGAMHFYRLTRRSRNAAGDSLRGKAEVFFENFIAKKRWPARDFSVATG